MRIWAGAQLRMSTRAATYESGVYGSHVCSPSCPVGYARPATRETPPSVSFAMWRLRVGGGGRVAARVTVRIRALGVGKRLVCFQDVGAKEARFSLRAAFGQECHFDQLELNFGSRSVEAKWGAAARFPRPGLMGQQT